MKKLIVFNVIALFGALTWVQAQTSTAPANDFAVTKARVQTLKETNYLYASTETSLRKVGPVIEQTMKELKAAMETNKIRPHGAPIFVYHNPTGEMDKPFTMEIGFPVEGNVTPPVNFKTRKLEALQSATILFSGSMQNMAEVYQGLYQQLGAPGMEPGNENREYFLYWEGVDSPNNVLMIQVGLQK